MAKFEPERIVSAKDFPNKSSRLVCALDGVDVNLDFKHAAGADALIVGFHGAIDRATRSIPAFINALPLAGSFAHQLLISDPSLRCGPSIKMGWFAGDAGFPAQTCLPEFVRAVAQVLGVDRVIYFGTSGGGFAALHASWHHPGSLALVGNPQISIGAYYPGFIREYLEVCWPGVSSLDDLGTRVVTDLRTLYAETVPNTVIYLQNLSDHFHLHCHMAPFLQAIQKTPLRQRVLCESSFPGRVGHSPAWAVFAPWLRAALVAPTWEAGVLLELRHRFGRETQDAPASQPGARAGKRGSEPAFAPEDIQMADLLRAHALRRPVEE